jgi:hypothetical protein
MPAASAPVSAAPAATAGVKIHISALYIRCDVSVAERGHQLAQIRHRNPVTCTQVDPAQQGDVSGHGGNLPEQTAPFTSPSLGDLQVGLWIVCY